MVIQVPRTIALPYLDQTATYATAGFDATRCCARPPREWHCGGQWPKRPGDARGEWKAPASGHIEGYNPTKGGWQGVRPSLPALVLSAPRARSVEPRHRPAGGFLLGALTCLEDVEVSGRGALYHCPPPRRRAHAASALSHLAHLGHTVGLYSHRGT